MKIFHTADLHLVEENDRRWDALVDIVAHARLESVDIFVISGDLFDSDADAEALRVPLRSVFDKVEFDTLVIPGNHDAGSYSAGLLFGDRVHILANAEWSKNVFDTEDSRFVGVSFEAIDSQEFHQRLRGLKDLIDQDRVNILLYHGELLDASFDRGSFGAEAGRYMPSRLAFFEELGVDYVLAGHFHRSFDVRRFGEKGYFVYPGSPVSVTRREVGQRKIALIELGKEPKAIEQDTAHYEQIVVILNAFEDQEPLDLIKASLKNIHSQATVLLRVDGTIRGSEEELAKAVIDLDIAKAIEPTFSFRDVDRVLSHPAFRLFEDRISHLQEGGDIAFDEEALRHVVIQAMTEAGL